MTTVTSLLPYLQIALSVILIVVILLQQSTGGAGGAFGDNFSAVHHTRRGLERVFFSATIILAILFALSALLALVVKA
ncbi:MAG: preprotein translocase subunit SecG [Patescibacteria group bacterium]